MIELKGGHQETAPYVDGVVRDIRQPLPNDDLLPGAVFGFGDHESGPLVSLTIEGRRFPRKAPVHMHKSDTFRMALGEPIVVGRTSYPHGEFRLQETDTFYGPEYWTDEVGTNQLLIIADRRGAKPYLAAQERQALVDESLVADATVGGVEMHERDANIDHSIANNLGARSHAGHWDAGFTTSSSWPEMADGTRLAVIALGDRNHGPLLLCWDRPAGCVPLPGFIIGTDVLKLVVDGTSNVEGIERGRLAFRLQAAGVRVGPWISGRDGAREVWCLASRNGLPMRSERPASKEAGALMLQVATEIDGVVERSRLQDTRVIRS